MQNIIKWCYDDVNKHSVTNANVFALKEMLMDIKSVDSHSSGVRNYLDTIIFIIMNTSNNLEPHIIWGFAQNEKETFIAGIHR